MLCHFVSKPCIKILVSFDIQLNRMNRTAKVFPLFFFFIVKIGHIGRKQVIVIFREFSFSNQTIEPELLNLPATIFVLALPCTKKHNIWSTISPPCVCFLTLKWTGIFDRKFYILSTSQFHPSRIFGFDSRPPAVPPFRWGLSRESQIIS